MTEDSSTEISTESALCEDCDVGEGERDVYLAGLERGAAAMACAALAIAEIARGQTVTGLLFAAAAVVDTLIAVAKARSLS